MSTHRSSKEESEDSNKMSSAKKKFKQITAKVKAQGLITNPPNAFRYKEFTFDFSREDLKSKFKEIAQSEDRIHKKDVLRAYLARTYQIKIADALTDFFRSYFDNYMGSITLEKFFRGIEKFVNKDPKEWQRMRFAIYDTKGKGKITEKALFKFI